VMMFVAAGLLWLNVNPCSNTNRKPVKTGRTTFCLECLSVQRTWRPSGGGMSRTL
jgi:hypothetical protein